MTDARADFSRARLGYANRGARFGERPFCVELTLNPGGQAVHHSHDARAALAVCEEAWLSGLGVR